MIGEPCETCQNPYPTRRRFVNEIRKWICDRCGASEVYFPDVFWDGKPEENLADGQDGKPITFLSRGQKARYLRERGIYEAGDSFHGAPFTTLTSESQSERRARIKQEVRSARMKVEAMSKDRRHQEFLRITKGHA